MKAVSPASPRFFRRSAQPVAVAFTLALALLPTLLVVTKEGGSAGFHLVLLLSIALLLFPSRPAEARAWTGAYQWLAAGMAVLLLAVLASLAVHGLWKGSEVEKAARLLCMPLILAAALRIPHRVLARALLGVLPAIWCAAAIIGRLVLESGQRPATQQFNAVTYGDLTLLFSVVCLLSMGLTLTRFARAEVAVKLLTGLLGVMVFLWTQTRGGLLAVPCFVLIALAVARVKGGFTKVALVAVLVTVVMGVASHQGPLRTRIDAGVNEYAGCRSGQLADTSVCIRLQLWGAALGMVRDEPLFGVGGGDRFRQRLTELAAEGRVTAFVAGNFGEAHNDLLYFLATYGVFGGLGLVLAYLSPALVLVPRLWHGAMESRVYAAAGLSICAGFALFGLTEMMLRDMRTASFYAAWVAMLVALSLPAASGQSAAKAAA